MYGTKHKDFVVQRLTKIVIKEKCKSDGIARQVNEWKQLN